MAPGNAVRGLANPPLRASTTASPEFCMPTSMLMVRWACTLCPASRGISQPQPYGYRKAMLSPESNVPLEQISDGQQKASGLPSLRSSTTTSTRFSISRLSAAESMDSSKTLKGWSCCPTKTDCHEESFQTFAAN